MKRIMVVMGVGSILLITPASALGSTPTKAHTHEYRVLYSKARKEFGKRAPGCNLFSSCSVKATDARVKKSIAVLQRMLYVPPKVSYSSSSTYSSTAPSAITTSSYSYGTQAPTATVPAPTGSSGSLPSCTWVPESGGNWSAVNSSSGAYGRYQIMPSTASAYGCNLGTHEGQTACAETIYANQGPSAWANC